jgi:GxxExxY protein
MDVKPSSGGRVEVPEAWNRVTEQIISAAIEVHSILGPGLLESLYEAAMEYELKRAGLVVARQRPLRMKYKEIVLGDMKLDLIVDDLVVVELKAIEKIHPVHLAQLLSYLRSADMPLGLLINFNHTRLVDGLHRRINPDSTRLLSPVSSPRHSALSGTSAFKS